MEPKTLISVDEYLRASFDPDCDYVEGELLERNVGEKDHGKLQFQLALWFRQHRKSYGTYAFIEQRLKIGPARFRVPDVCVYLGGEPSEQVFSTPPFLCIEVLSPEDRFSRIEQRVGDYFQFGVKSVWVIDPFERKAWEYRSGERREADKGVLRTQDPEIVVSLDEIFAAMDQ
jgi:Uma2 family endonuclease